MKITSAFYANGATCVLYHTSPQYFISGLTPDDFGWNRWVSCSLHMAALMHSNYRKVGFLLQSKQTKKRVMQGTFTSLDDWAAEGSGKLTSCLANRTAHAACCAHVSWRPGTIPCSPCQPSFPIHLEGGTCPHAFTQRFSSSGRFQQGQPHHQQCSDHILFKYMKMWVF